MLRLRNVLRPYISVAVWCALLATAAGCGGEDAVASDLVEAEIAKRTEIAEAMFAGVPPEEVARLNGELESICDEFRALGLDAEKRRAVVGKYREEMVAAKNRMSAAAQAKIWEARSRSGKRSDG